MRKLPVIVLLLCPVCISAQELGLVSSGQISGQEGVRLEKISSFFYDETRESILAANTGTNRVEVFDRQGRHLYGLGDKGELSLPISTAVTPSGRTFILEQKNPILRIYDEQAKKFESFDLSQLEAGKNASFTRVYTDKNEDLFLVDSRHNQVLILDKNMKPAGKISSSGKWDGKLQEIVSLAFDNSGRVYLADAISHPVQVFDTKGRFLFRFEESTPNSRFWKPSGIFVDLKNRVWAIDQSRSCLKIFDSNGNLLQEIDSADQKVRRFFFPIQIALDKYGYLYLLEQGTNQISIFKVENF